MEAGTERYADDTVEEVGTASRQSARTTRRGIPRVLPPDAAIEDVRDALALESEERTTALREASQAISRLAAQGEDALRPLRKYARKVEDPVARGVVVASLGTARSDENIRTLAESWSRGATDAERMGALIALAHPQKNESSSPDEATSEVLASLPYQHVALPTSMTVLKAGARFLDRSQGALSQDALPVLLRSIGSHREWAALLVVDEERMCAWYASLPAEDRARVRVEALKHDQLRGNTRRVIEDAE